MGYDYTTNDLDQPLSPQNKQGTTRTISQEASLEYDDQETQDYRKS